MALSQLFWDVLMPWNLKSTYFSLKMIHFLSLKIWYVIYVVFWIKYWNLKLPHHCILFLFTICTVSQLFWNRFVYILYNHVVQPRCRNMKRPRPSWLFAKVHKSVRILNSFIYFYLYVKARIVRVVDCSCHVVQLPKKLIIYLLINLRYL